MKSEKWISIIVLAAIDVEYLFFKRKLTSQSLSNSLPLIITSSRSSWIHISVVAFRLRMNCRISVDLCEMEGSKAIQRRLQMTSSLFRRRGRASRKSLDNDHLPEVLASKNLALVLLANPKRFRVPKKLVLILSGERRKK